MLIIFWFYFKKAYLVDLQLSLVLLINTMADIESFYNIFILKALTVCVIPALCKPLFLESWF